MNEQFLVFQSLTSLYTTLLQGSLATESAVLKLSGKIVEEFEGKAIVFDNEDAAFSGIMTGKVRKGHVVVIRYEGPRGSPGMPEMLSPGAALIGAGEANSS